MKILLVQPPIDDFYITTSRIYPLGLHAIASYLKERKIKTRVFNSLKGKKTNLPIPKIFPSFSIAQQNQRNLNPFSFFSQYYLFGSDWKERLKKEIDSFLPQLIGISFNFTAYSKTAHQVLKWLKENYPQTIYIGGGWHLSVLREKSFSFYPELDYIIIGPGEEPLFQLIKYLKKEQKDFPINTISHHQLVPIFSDYYPTYQKRLSYEENYTIFSSRAHTLFLSRGCPHRCKFCSTGNFFQGKFFFRPLKEIKEEINFFYQKGIKTFNFEDDNFLAEEKESEEFLKFLANNYQDLNLYAMNGIEATYLNQRKLFLLKKAGFRKLDISLTSTSFKLTKEWRRPFHADKLNNFLTEATNLQLPLTLYFIAGAPEGKLEDDINTLKFIIQTRALIGISLFYNIPGIPYWKENIPFECARMTSLFPFTSDYNPVISEEFFYLARFFNFLKKCLDEKIIPFKKIEEKINLPQKLTKLELTQIAAYYLAFKGEKIKIYLKKNKNKKEFQYLIKREKHSLWTNFFQKGKIIINGYQKNILTDIEKIKTQYPDRHN